eukprot:2901871-Amphidinium_carterae.1
MTRCKGVLHSIRTMSDERSHAMNQRFNANIISGLHDDVMILLSHVGQVGNRLKQTLDSDAMTSCSKWRRQAIGGILCAASSRVCREDSRASQQPSSAKL